MRLGIYVGSFNPVHKGHISVVNYLLENKYVDQILIVPTLNYWDKQDLIDINSRIAMLKFYENDQIKIDTKHNEYIYTIELLEELKKEYPNKDLYLILGADNMINFDKWKRYQDLLKYQIIVMNRDNIDVDKYIKKLDCKNILVINDYPFIHISSTEIRKNINTKYLDSKVINYIKENNLYQE